MREVNRRHALALLGSMPALALLGSTGPASAAAAPSRIATENERAGTSDWWLRRPADDFGLEIKGFANLTSVNIGGSIDLHVSVSRAQTFTVEIFRMGWYQGRGARSMGTLGPYAGVTRSAPSVDPTTGKITTNWPVSLRLDVPTAWESGSYLAKLTRADGFDNFIPFVVRDDARRADLMVQLPVTTYQAYNGFPKNGRTGKSLYDYNSNGAAPTAGEPNKPRARTVSFDRPYEGWGSGQFLTFDYPAIRWLERNGYDLVYSTNIDTHSHGERIRNHRAFVSLGHDEYWTSEMFDAAEAARDDPAADTDLAFLGANNVYWRISLGPSSRGPNREITCAKDYNRDRFREQGRPEQQLIGVQYNPPYRDEYHPLVVADADSFVWAGAGVGEGTVLGPNTTAHGRNLVGYEIDSLDPGAPGPDFRQRFLLASSPFTDCDANTLLCSPSGQTLHQTSMYQAPSGSWVFAAGTLGWSFGLGSVEYPDLENAAIQRATANVLERFLSDPDQNLMAQARTMDELVAASDYETARDGDVLRLYRAFFDREPDIGGALYWLGVRKDYGLTQIAVFFTASQEYVNNYAGTTDREFLRRVYRNVLGRSFDQSGFDYWLGVLRAGTSRGEVVRWVAASEEFKAFYPYRP